MHGPQHWNPKGISCYSLVTIIDSLSSQLLTANPAETSQKFLLWLPRLMWSTPSPQTPPPTPYTTVPSLKNSGTKRNTMPAAAVHYYFTIPLRGVHRGAEMTSSLTFALLDVCCDEISTWYPLSPSHIHTNTLTHTKNSPQFLSCSPGWKQMLFGCEVSSRRVNSHAGLEFTISGYLRSEPGPSSDHYILELC